MKTKHSLFNIAIFKLSRTFYKEVYKVLISQGEYENCGLPKYSLLDAIMDHLRGRKYYCVLLSRNLIKVKGTNGKKPYEMSCDIFFSEAEAWQYYERFHATEKNATYDTHQIVSFRSKEKIPVWNSQRDPDYNRLY